MASVDRDPSGIEIRLDDGWVETAGAGLEAGGSAEASLSDLAHGQRYSVQFWDANATKALHVGHLRNLSIGNALAPRSTQAGGQVERRSLISDAGRSMGEAMAGVRRMRTAGPTATRRAITSSASATPTTSPRRRSRPPAATASSPRTPRPAS